MSIRQRTPERGGDVLEQLAERGAAASLSSAGGGSGSHGRVAVGDGREHAGRRVADAEQAALALGEHLEADRGLVERRREALELAQRLPLRLADGLAGRLDRRARRVTARAPPFFRFTRRGCGWARSARGLGFGGSVGAPLPAPPLPAAASVGGEPSRRGRTSAAASASSARAGA